MMVRCEVGWKLFDQDVARAISTLDLLTLRPNKLEMSPAAIDRVEIGLNQVPSQVSPNEWHAHILLLLAFCRPALNVILISRVGLTRTLID